MQKNQLRKGQTYTSPMGVTCGWSPSLQRWRLLWPDESKASGRTQRNIEDRDEAWRELLRIDGLLGTGAGVQFAATNRPLARMSDVLDYCLVPRHHDRDYSARYLKNLRIELGKWVKRTPFGEVTASQISEDDLIDLFTLAREELAASSAQQVAVKVSWLIREGRRHNFIPPSFQPQVTTLVGAREVRTVGTSQKYVDKRYRPTCEDVEALAEAMEFARPKETWRRLQVYMMGFAGLRWAEAAALTPEAFDLDRQAVNVDWQTEWADDGVTLAPPKYGMTRTAYYPPWLVPLLAARFEEVGPGGILFPRWDDPNEYEPYRKWGERLDEVRPDLGGRWMERKSHTSQPRWVWTGHSLRHHYATWLLDPKPDGLGLPIRKVSVYLGHASTRTTWETYIGQEDDDGESFRAAFA